MTWNEFCSYLNGIMEDTPLGRIVSTRSETDREKIKSFTKEQKRIHTEWQTRNVKKIDINSNDYSDVINGFKNMFKNLAEGGE